MSLMPSGTIDTLNTLTIEPIALLFYYTLDTEFRAPGQ